MRLSKLAALAGLPLLANPQNAAAAEIMRVCTANRISELLSEAAPTTLLVTALANRHLAHVAELTESPAICLANSVVPDASLLEAARTRGLVLLTSPEDPARTADRLYRALQSEGGT